jgi:hypothetical protein
MEENNLHKGGQMKINPYNILIVAIVFLFCTALLVYGEQETAPAENLEAVTGVKDLEELKSPPDNVPEIDYLKMELKAIEQEFRANELSLRLIKQSRTEQNRIEKEIMEAQADLKARHDVISDKIKALESAD